MSQHSPTLAQGQLHAEVRLPKRVTSDWRRGRAGLDGGTGESVWSLLHKSALIQRSAHPRRQGLHGDCHAGHAGIAGEHEAGHVHELPAAEVGGGRRGEGGVQVFLAAVSVASVEDNGDGGVRAASAHRALVREAVDKVRQSRE